MVGPVVLVVLVVLMEATPGKLFDCEPFAVVATLSLGLRPAGRSVCPPVLFIDMTGDINATHASPLASLFAVLLGVRNHKTTERCACTVVVVVVIIILLVLLLLLLMS